MSSMTLTTSPVVFQKDGKVFASSLDVADFFEKRHDHVLATIDALDVPADFKLPNFREVLVRLDREGRGSISRRAFDMTRDGFMMLVMGFTGPKAARFKIAYIEAFNQMEADLHAAATNLDNPEVLLSILAKYAKRVQVAEAKVTELAPKAALVDVHHSTNLTLCSFARTLHGMNAHAIKRDLEELRYLYRPGPQGARRVARYRVFAEFRDTLFVEKQGPSGMDIFPTTLGKVELAKLYRHGRLTMRAGYRPA